MRAMRQKCNLKAKQKQKGAQEEKIFCQSLTFSHPRDCDLT